MLDVIFLLLRRLLSLRRLDVLSTTFVVRCIKGIEGDLIEGLVDNY